MTVRLIANLPSPCPDGLLVFDWCVPWLAIGLLLGVVLLAGLNLFRASRQFGRRLDDSQQWPAAPGRPVPRISLVQLAPAESEGRP